MLTDAQARKIFDAVIAKATSPDTTARLEIAREYFTNPEFRKNLENTVATINGV